MLRRMDNLGRVVIPKVYRKQLNYGYRQMVDITLMGKNIQIQRAQPYCFMCGKQKELKEFNEYTFLCRHCIDSIFDRFDRPSD